VAELNQEQASFIKAAREELERAEKELERRLAAGEKLERRMPEDKTDFPVGVVLRTETEEDAET
jgi:transcription elongation GreA/GreB family factor